MKKQKQCEYTKLICLDYPQKSCVCCVAKEAYKQGNIDMLNKLLQEPYVYWTSLRLTRWIEHELKKLKK